MMSDIENKLKCLMYKQNRRTFYLLNDVICCGDFIVPFDGGICVCNGAAVLHPAGSVPPEVRTASSGG